MSSGLSNHGRPRFVNPARGHVIVSHKSSVKFKLDNNRTASLKLQRKVQTFLDLSDKSADHDSSSRVRSVGEISPRPAAYWKEMAVGDIPVIDEIRGPTDSYSERIWICHR